MYTSCPEDSIWQLSSSSSCSSILYAPSSVMLTEHTGADTAVDGWALSSYLSRILWSVVNLSTDYCPRHGQALWPRLRVSLISAYQRLQPSSLMIISHWKSLGIYLVNAVFQILRTFISSGISWISLCTWSTKKARKTSAWWVLTEVQWFNCFSFSREKPTSLPPVRRIFQTSVSTRTSKPFHLSTSWPHM